MTRFRTIASYLPAKVRGAIYSLLGTAYLLELIFHFMSAWWESKVLAAAGVLGFSLAAGNTPTADDLDGGDA